MTSAFRAASGARLEGLEDRRYRAPRDRVGDAIRGGAVLSEERRGVERAGAGGEVVLVEDLERRVLPDPLVGLGAAGLELEAHVNEVTGGLVVRVEPAGLEAERRDRAAEERI